MLSLLLIVLAQTELSPTWDFAQNLGVAGIVAAILGWQLSLRVKELREKDQAFAKRDAERDAELRAANQKLLELAERALPLLGDAARALTDAAGRHDGAPGTEELRAALRRLEQQLGDLHGREP